MYNKPSDPLPFHSFPISERYSVEFDATTSVLWSIWRLADRPCFSPALLQDMQFGISTIADGSFPAAALFRYFVLRSEHRQIFNLGGDLEFFREKIITGDRQGLLSYAQQAADMMFALYSGFGRGATTIALVQGKCLGGGFEAAIACDYLIAHRDAQFSFPEIQLGIFPGMGALSLLSRRLPKRDYEALCHTGRVFHAEELHAMGIVDILTDAGDDSAEHAFDEFVRKRRHAISAHNTMLAIRKSADGLSKEDFHAGLTRWVDIVMSLDKRRLAMLELTIQKQRAG